MSVVLAVLAAWVVLNLAIGMLAPDEDGEPSTSS